MALHNPPFYRYPLFDEWAKGIFNEIINLAINKQYPKVLGTDENKNQYLIALIRTQKALHNWEAILIDTMNQIQNQMSINTTELNRKFPSESISKEIPAWVTYKEDQIVNDFIDNLEARKITFTGTDEEMSEFVLRFILGQLGNDWELTILMFQEVLGDNTTLQLSQLNQEMKNFDYLKLFE